MTIDNNIAAIILAAGSASRMGKPKQLLPIAGKKLLEHVISLTLRINFHVVFAVLGYESKKIKRSIHVDHHRFRFIVNDQYQTGQSSSIKCAIHELPEHINHVMIFLGDVPFVREATVQKIVEVGIEVGHTTKNPFVIRPTYNNKGGHPVFFGNIDRQSFEQLQGDVGAKKIVQYIKNITKIPVDDQAIIFDIDTPTDYELAKNFIKR